MFVYIYIILMIIIIFSKKKKFEQIYKLKDIKKMIDRDLSYNERDKDITNMPDFLKKKLIPELRHPRNVLFLDILWSLGLFIGFFFIILYKVKKNKTVSIIFSIVYLVFLYKHYCARFILLLHFGTHRSIMKEDSIYKNRIKLFMDFFSMFFGIPYGIYELHHRKMHHVEDNGPEDLSSTALYDRSKKSNFLFYWLKHLFYTISFGLIRFGIKKKLYENIIYSLIGYFVYYKTIIYLKDIIPVFYIFILPFLITSFALMLGNYGQHIFIDPKDPQNDMLLTYNIIGGDYNQLVHNDGYHVMHHLNPGTPWSELPNEFLKSMKKLRDVDAITFHSLSFFDISTAVLTNNFDKLCNHYVSLNGKKRSCSDIKKLLKKRLNKIY